MKVLPFLLLPLLGGLAATAAEPKHQVLLITGGHGFVRNEFLEVFQSNPAIEFTLVTHARGTSSAYDREDLLRHDCVVLYDMVQEITAAQQARLRAVLDRGIGLVVLHHALVSYRAWPEFEQIVGGTYPEPPDRKGVVTEALGYQHNVEIPVVILAQDHPVTRGVGDFTLTDEIYWGFRVSPGVTPLLTTTHPKSGKPLGWTHQVRNSRVVYLQSGHGPSAYRNPHYRQLVAQAIRWTAQGKPAGP